MFSKCDFGDQQQKRQELHSTSASCVTSCCFCSFIFSFYENENLKSNNKTDASKNGLSCAIPSIAHLSIIAIEALNIEIIFIWTRTKFSKVFLFFLRSIIKIKFKILKSYFILRIKGYEFRGQVSHIEEFNSILIKFLWLIFNRKIRYSESN